MTAPVTSLPEGTKSVEELTPEAVPPDWPPLLEGSQPEKRNKSTTSEKNNDVDFLDGVILKSFLFTSSIILSNEISANTGNSQRLLRRASPPLFEDHAKTTLQPYI
ncbi:MAG: hypothetical protein WAU91_19720 [Desulfatitalea sp.]